MNCLVFEYEGQKELIHIGTHSQCYKTLCSFNTAYDLLKRHFVVPGVQAEEFMNLLYIELLSEYERKNK